MFLSNLSKNEKYAFYSLTNQFVRADKIIAKEEKKIINQLKLELHLAENEKPKEMTFERACATFKNRTSKVSAMLEIIGIGHVDANYSSEESYFVRNMATLMGFSSGEVLEMEDLVLRILSLTNEATEYMKGK